MKLCRYPGPPQIRSCPQQLLLCCLPSGDFARQPFLFHYSLGCFCKEELSLSISVYLSVIYLHQDGLVMLWGVIQLYPHLFLAQTVPASAIGSSLRLGPAFCQQPHLLKTHPFLVPQNVPGSACCVLPRFWNQPLLQGPLVSYAGRHRRYWGFSSRHRSKASITIKGVILLAEGLAFHV